MKRITKGARAHLLKITRRRRRRAILCWPAALASLADLGFYDIPNPILPGGLKPIGKK